MLSFQATQPQLKGILESVSMVHKSRVPSEILMNALIEVQDGTVTFSAANFSTAIRAGLHDPTAVNGRALVPLAQLYKLVSAGYKTEVVSITDEGNNLRVENGASRYTIPTVPVEDYPESIFEKKDGQSFSIPRATLATIASAVAPFAAEDESRPILQAISFVIKGGALRASCADGFRLSLLDCSLEGVPDSKFLIYAGSFAEEIIPALKGENITVILEPNRITFQDGHIEVSTLLVEGNFPDLTGMLKQVEEYNGRISLPVAAFMPMLKRTTIFAGDKAGLDLTVADGTLTVSTKSQVGRAEDKAAVTQEGEGISVKINPNYAKDVLSAAEGHVMMDYRKPNNPLRFSTSGIEGWQLIVMPMYSEGEGR